MNTRSAQRARCLIRRMSIRNLIFSLSSQSCLRNLPHLYCYFYHRSLALVKPVDILTTYPRTDGGTSAPTTNRLEEPSMPGRSSLTILGFWPWPVQQYPAPTEQHSQSEPSTRNLDPMRRRPKDEPLPGEPFATYMLQSAPLNLRYTPVPSIVQHQSFRTATVTIALRSSLRDLPLAPRVGRSPSR